MYESLSKVESRLNSSKRLSVGGALPLVKKVMTASELFSLSQWLRSQASFQTFALNCCFPETLAEVVLGAVASAVTAVTDDRNYEFHVLLVVREDLFESVTQVVEVRLFRHFWLEDAGLNGRGGLCAWVWVTHAHATLAAFEEVALSCLSSADVEVGRRAPHAGISRTAPISGHLDSTWQ